MSSAVGEPTRESSVRMTYFDAIVQAQLEELERDERVILMGENLAVYGDEKVVARMPNRVWNTPISETKHSVLSNAA
jgi:acetoin:2,6-dichlorophenolindophenol oxidoreductase subunit beta